MTRAEWVVGWLACLALAYIIGLNVGESGEQRRLSKIRDDGMVIASLPPPKADIRCGKQEIREYLNACATRARMEKVKAP